MWNISSLPGNELSWMIISLASEGNDWVQWSLRSAPLVGWGSPHPLSSCCSPQPFPTHSLRWKWMGVEIRTAKVRIYRCRHNIGIFLKVAVWSLASALWKAAWVPHGPSPSLRPPTIGTLTWFCLFCLKSMYFPSVQLPFWPSRGHLPF